MAENGEATPDDYLEKIFQIPFSVRPLDDPARSSIIQGLLRDHVSGGVVDAEPQPGSDKPTLDPATAPPSLQAATMSVTQGELEFLDKLAPLLGSTPRSTKRFVNVYRHCQLANEGTFFSVDAQLPRSVRRRTYWQVRKASRSTSVPTGEPS